LEEEQEPVRRVSGEREPRERDAAAANAPRPKKPVAPRAEESREPADPPPGEAMQVKPLSKELRKVLEDWEFHSSRIEKLGGEYKMIKYDCVSRIERQSKGIFAYIHPDKGVFKSTGLEFPPGTKSSNREAPDGEPFTVVSGEDNHWVCTGTEIFDFDHKEKEFGVADVPPEYRGKNIVESPLPFVFGMKVEYANTRYDFELLPSRDPKFIKLRAWPRMQRDRAHWEEALIILSKENFLPTAVKLISPGGKSVGDIPGNDDAIVYSFDHSKLKINQNLGSWFKADPFKEAESLANRYKLRLNVVGPGSVRPASRNLEQTAEVPPDDNPPARKGSGAARTPRGKN
jgi:TIGR03009 family protein